MDKIYTTINDGSDGKEADLSGIEWEPKEGTETYVDGKLIGKAEFDVMKRGEQPEEEPEEKKTPLQELREKQESDPVGKGLVLNEEETTTAEQPVERPVMVHNPNMYIYFDCEMTGLSMKDQLLSIGLIDAQGHTFYAEFTDFTYGNITPWVFENVLKNFTKPERKLNGDYWTTTGTKADIRKDLLSWISAVRRHTGCPGIQMVADCSHYDMVFLIDLLFGDAMSIPSWFSPVCVDINQDMATLVEVNNHKDDTVSTNIHLGPMYNPYKQTFDMSREEQLKYIPNTEDIQGAKHNALFDAKVVRAIHQYIQMYQLNFYPLSRVAE